jgi:hypothetical protein
MPGLTVTEKEHWKDRIGKRIDKKIEAITAEEPNLLDRIHRDARERALASLGLAEMQRELDTIAQQRTTQEKRERQIQRAMLAHVRGVPVEDIDEHFRYQYDREVENAVKRRQAVHEDELLNESDVGRRIMNLRVEKENLLDTVWLATSPKQVKELWSKVALLLGDDQTQLQREALAIVPVEE